MATASIFGNSSFIQVEGEGMVHATYFSKDTSGNWTMLYKNRYIESDSYMIEKEQNKPLFLPAAEGKPPAILAAFVLNLLRFGIVNKEASNTNVFEHAGKVYSVAENHFPYEIDISNLDTRNVWTLSGSWGRPFTSHPKKDPKTGEMIIMGVDAKKPYYVLGVVSADGNKLTHKVDIKFNRSTLCHEVGVTENYNIIMDYPLMIDVGRLFRGGSLIKFEKNRGSRIGVMPRYGTEESVVWFGVETHCTFHIINSFEDGDEVVLIGCRSTGSIIPGPDYGIDKLKWFQRAFTPVLAAGDDFDPSIDGTILPCPYEWRLNMKTGAVKEGNLTGPEFAMDFPAINNSIMGMKNKYGYTQVLDTISSSNLGMAKFNKFAKLYFEEEENKFMKEGEKRIKVEYHVLEDNCFCSGLQFVGKPSGIDEDDGWLICYVHNEKTNLSQVHIIDAKRFPEGAVAKITLPQRVPYGFHGTFIRR
ncbi:hypothetical protein AAC387_Pa02g2625 [Persea americana]